MEAKDKAKEMMHYYLKELLSAKYSINGFVINDLAKQCALIAVDEILRNSYYKDELVTLRYKGSLFINPLTESKEYWTEVKSEIEKL